MVAETVEKAVEVKEVKDVAVSAAIEKPAGRRGKPQKEAVAEAPKRRGRPRKEAAPARRPGRPRKEEAAPAAKRPGRPRKVVLDVARILRKPAAENGAPRGRRKSESASNTLEFQMLYTESGAYETTMNKMFSRRHRWEQDDPRRILSFMPGTVEQVLVRVGQEVKEGDELMIFRAMKMNNHILAPVAGRVGAINVSVGENVPKNTVMIELK